MGIDKSSFENKVTAFHEKLGKEIINLPLPQKPEYLYNPINYVLSGPGKRLRPILLYLVGSSYKADQEDILHAALAIEMLHNFTLVHDDIMDMDDFRHGQQAVHAKWDNSTAILAGDGMFAYSQLILAEVSVNALEILKVFNQAALIVCEGQAFDKEFEHNTSVSLKQYFSMIEKKTGFLISSSAKIGGLLGNQPNEILDRLESYGLNLGRAFQIQDDILEIFSTSQAMGKSLGSDLVEGKQTVLTILARENDIESWKNFWRSVEGKQVEDIIIDLREYLINNGILEKANGLVEKYIIAANDDLLVIPEDSRNDLYLFSEKVLNRKH